MDILSGKGKTTLKGVAAGVLMVILSLSLYAQDFTVDDADKENGKTFNIDVTAQKREEKLQDVAASITALDVNDVKDGDVDDTQDIAPYVPNMQTYSFTNSFSYYSLRGQTNANSYSNPVGIYVDDVPLIANGNWTDTPLWGIEQIEVLRGPQGNLYGLNSSGGVINIRTRQPDDFWTADGSASYGNYNMADLKANVSGPLVKEKLYIGAAGNYRRADSFIEEKGNDDRSSWYGGGRGVVRYHPFSSLDLTAAVQSSHYDANFNQWTLEDDDPYTIENHNHDEYNRYTGHTQSLKAEYAGDSLDIISVSAHSTGDMKGDMELFTGGEMFCEWGMDTSLWAEELRFVSNDRKSPLQWLFGGFFRTADQSYGANYGSPETQTDSEVKQNTWAAFAEVSYTFFDLLTLKPGIRYDYDEKEMEQKSVMYGNLDDGKNWSSVSPRFTADYKVSDNVLVYASVANGHKAGGYAMDSSANKEDTKFDQENLMSYELGTKLGWLDSRLVTNIAGFYNDVDDMQLFYLNPETGTHVYTNAARAKVYGIEGEILARPLRELEIGLPLGWMKSEIVEHRTSSYEGNRVPLVPQYTAGCFVQYTHNVGAFIRGEFNQLGKTWFDESNELSQDSYNVINMKAGVNREHYSVSAYCKNILNTEYYNYKVEYMTSEHNMAAVGTPRTFGLQIAAEF